MQYRIALHHLLSKAGESEKAPYQERRPNVSAEDSGVVPLSGEVVSLALQRSQQLDYVRSRRLTRAKFGQSAPGARFLRRRHPLDAKETTNIFFCNVKEDHWLHFRLLEL